MKLARRVSLCALLLIPITLAWAQDDPANRRQERRQDRQEERTRTTTARDTTSDNVSQQVISEFATLLAIKNQEEIELARWASEKTQNDEVRQFCQKLVEDHTKMLSNLQQFKPVMEVATTFESQETTTTSTRTGDRNTRREERREEGRNPNPDQPNPDQPKPDQPNPDQPRPDQDRQGQNDRDRDNRRGEAAAEGTDTQVTRTTTVAAGGADQQVHLRVAQESARRCLEMTKEKLGSKEGQDFDRCFIGGQIVGHVGMIAKMQAQQQFASAEYSQVLEQGIQGAQSHLKHAEALAQKLEGGGAHGAKEGAARNRTEGANRNEGAAANRNREGANSDNNENPNP